MPPLADTAREDEAGRGAARSATVMVFRVDMAYAECAATSCRRLLASVLRTSIGRGEKKRKRGGWTNEEDAKVLVIPMFKIAGYGFYRLVSVEAKKGYSRL